MRAKLLRDATHKGQPKHKAGDIIDHPDAWQLVLCGMAEPADDECRLEAGLKHKPPLPDGITADDVSRLSKQQVRLETEVFDPQTGKRSKAKREAANAD